MKLNLETIDNKQEIYVKDKKDPMDKWENF